MNKKTIKEKDPWAIAKKRYRLNTHQIAMAKELGMNPKKFGKLVPNKSELWKEPLGRFIERCYLKRFKKKPFIKKDKDILF